MNAQEETMELGDDDIIDVATDMNDTMGDLAKLVDGSGKPELRGAVEWNELERAEAWAVSLVMAGFTLEAIQKMSPLCEDSTTELLAKLVTTRTIRMR